jgi:adenylosuccinate lyase
MRLAGMVEKLTVYPARMEENLESLGGVVHSQKVLLALTQAGLSREAAYAAVQRAAMETWLKLGRPEGRRFRDNLLADPEVAPRLSAEALDAAMNPALDFRHVETIFARVFGKA